MNDQATPVPTTYAVRLAAQRSAEELAQGLARLVSQGAHVEGGDIQPSKLGGYVGIVIGYRGSPETGSLALAGTMPARSCDGSDARGLPLPAVGGKRALARASTSSTGARTGSHHHT